MTTPQPDDNGFVKRGFFLLAGMAILAAVVLSIIFFNPQRVAPGDFKDLPANASGPGWTIRYNAANTLLRRGSDQVPWALVREMLDEKQQLKNSEFQLPDGRTVPNEAQARYFVIAALKSLADWTKQSGKSLDDVAAPEIRSQVDSLANSAIPELRRQATMTRQALEKK
jgi:hypothetical protein